jgi:hypothetical protein
LIQIKPGRRRGSYNFQVSWSERAMTKTIPDKEEVAVEYPDKLYIGTFERTAQFEAHLDTAGISLSLHRTGAEDVRKSVRMHFHYALFAEILRDLAKTAASLPADDFSHREALRDAAQALYLALAGDERGRDDTADLTAQDEVRLLHIME